MSREETEVVQKERLSPRRVVVHALCTLVLTWLIAAEVLGSLVLIKLILGATDPQ